MKTLFLLAALMLSPLAAFAQTPARATEMKSAAEKPACGGDLATWAHDLALQAKAEGVSEAALRQLSRAAIDEKILGRDRSQPTLGTTFIDFSRQVVTDSRLHKGREYLSRYKTVFNKAEKTYGVPAAVIAAIWGFETNYGASQSHYNTLNALFTLAYDCRRPDLFRPQLIALLKLFDLGYADAATTGAWAGEIGQMQYLPLNYLKYGVDGDGDGKVDLENSAPDAIMTTAHMLHKLGWKRNQPWLDEARFTRKTIPWQAAGRNKRQSLTLWAKQGVVLARGSHKTAQVPHTGPYKGLKAALILPMGRKGPAFFAYSNFDVLQEWNKSGLYVTTIAYFAARLAGEPAFNPGNPEPMLNREDMKLLQQRLIERGHDIGPVDGILGAMTREAVRQEQLRLKQPADAWPTKELLERLSAPHWKQEQKQIIKR